MSTILRWSAGIRRWCQSLVDGVAVFVRDIGSGMLDVSHNLLALVGLAAVVAVVFVSGHKDLRSSIELQALGWLKDRHVPVVPAKAPEVAAVLPPAAPQAVDRATAINLKHLTQQQVAVANWLSRRYRVAAEPVARLVQEAWLVGSKVGVEPTLILAIMAIESSFNPFAQSSVGAQGLMQVMTRVHDDKFERFGGNYAAFDPVANLRVGVQILKDCIIRAGSLEGGLRHYVGAANLPDDGGYAAKVFAEQSHLNQVVSGKAVPFNAPLTIAAASSSAAKAATARLAANMPATFAGFAWAVPGAFETAGSVTPSTPSSTAVAAHPFDATPALGPTYLTQVLVATNQLVPLPSPATAPLVLVSPQPKPAAAPTAAAGPTAAPPAGPSVAATVKPPVASAVEPFAVPSGTSSQGATVNTPAAVMPVVSPIGPTSLMPQPALGLQHDALVSTPATNPARLAGL